ncbi:hypothetical protein MMC17_008223 [Xylographa soralifera]|nr:hypothetical protein [Xylographa soralifera]
MTSTTKQGTGVAFCPNFEFVTFVGQPSEGSYTAGSRELIRRHAMKDFVRRREAGSSSSSVHPMHKTGLDSTMKSADPNKMIGKFKLLSWSRKKSTRKSSVIGQAVVSQPVGQAPKAAAHWRNRGNEDREQRTVLVKTPSTGKFDPFNALPIDVGPGFEALVYHYNTGFTQNSLAINPEGKWFPYAAGDAALLHATFFLVALHRDLQLGTELSSQCLYHRGEVIRTVNGRIGPPEREISDATIGAVAFLANFETMNGTVQASRVHMNGLRQMVALRGGLHTLGQSQVLQRVVIWADFLYSAATYTEPSFPLIIPSITSAEYPAASSDAMSPSLATLPGGSFLESECVDIIQDLRSLTVQAANPQSMSMRDRKAFSSTIYLLEYQLLSHHGGPSSVQKYSQTPASLRLAAHLYLYLAVRELPSSAELHHRMATRLQIAAIAGVQAGLDFPGYNHDLFLWIIFIGGAALSGQSDQHWFVSELRIICYTLQISSLDQFKERLTKILWHEKFFTRHAPVLWAEVEQSLL